jgi:AraC family transcriptional regulator, transcriptional activator FtrA
VALDFGAEIANALARRMVVPPRRDGGQAQFVETPVIGVQFDDGFSETLQWVQTHLNEQVTVESLAPSDDERPNFCSAFSSYDRHHALSLGSAPAGGARSTPRVRHKS